MTQSRSSAVNWVFLGDSLTEGVGSERVSHVTELVKQLRADLDGVGGSPLVHHMRLRTVDPGSFDRFVQFNVAGYMNVDVKERCADALWIWNLACEGRTIDTDFKWLPLIASIRPELVVIFRGSLESIIRPAMLQDGSWPMWVPRSWRSYSAMDPRCYFSSSSWRRMKQTAVDSLKQRMRSSLLRSRPGRPLMDLELLGEHYDRLVTELAKLDTRIVMLGLLPVGRHFPESASYFERVNQRLRNVATSRGVDFFDWANQLALDGYDKLFYRDTFHPNVDGAQKLAQILRHHLGNGMNR